ncbi:hypothetical protein [Bradyrhizobium sp.]|uniref:hypothetical protein n=1 Tax=Bradyrhizobium sp. TaxID=376 RepID=UPI001EC3495F|nr:hypothetical protein [Bradyrhizobium sp.]MBV9984511.1 hypothetical protein [Bradyrhizobium sp.]
MTPLVVIVGADKGGVGKTQVCRALRSYFDRPDMQDLPRPRTLDGQFPRGDLVQFHPEAEIINITDVAGQMRIFDTLEGVTLVDIAAGQLGTMLHACDEARLFEDVKTGTLRLALLHVLGPSISSMDEIKHAISMLGTSATHFIVKNHINETNFFDWDQDSQYAASLRALANITIDVPHLNTVANEAVQQAKTSFLSFVASDGSRTLRGHAARWVEKVFGEFDRVGLGTLIRGAA